MVKFLLFAIVTITTFGLGSWAYKINYESRAASQRVKSLEKAILSAKKERKILEAEWAHLNSPDRLRKLIEYLYRAPHREKFIGNFRSSPPPPSPRNPRDFGPKWEISGRE